MYYEGEQVSLFGADMPFGKTSPDVSAATAVATSNPSSRSSFESQTLTLHPFLCLVKANGENGGGTWEKDPTVGGVLPTEFTTLNFGGYRKDGEEYAFSLITADGQHTGYCLTLNTGEKPRNPIPSKLSQILEKNPDPKYRLSSKACQGILNRAERRGKKLPLALEAALRAQSASKNEPESRGVKESLFSESEQAHCLPSKTSTSLPKSETPTYCLQGNGIDRADTAGCNGKGWREDASYTLNTIDRPAVAYGIDQQGGKGGANYSTDVTPPILSDSHGTPHAVAYDGICKSVTKSDSQIYDEALSAIPINTMVGTRETLENRTTFGVGEEGDPQFTLSAAHEHAVFAFTQNQRNEVRDLHDVSGSLSAQPGMKQQTYVVTAGFKGGQGDKAGSIGYADELSPTLSATPSGTNQVPSVLTDEPLMIEMTSTKNTIIDDGVSCTLTARMGTWGNQVNAVLEKNDVHRIEIL